mmetsp:Transcript_35020/g.91672  ORF Transcript_35020/g.91672 Transcript_35020/m.91672 type:complete len:238 (-) Transcript_35020:740-1453(-)
MRRPGVLQRLDVLLPRVLFFASVEVNLADRAICQPHYDLTVLAMRHGHRCDGDVVDGVLGVRTGRLEVEMLLGLGELVQRPDAHAAVHGGGDQGVGLVGPDHFHRVDGVRVPAATVGGQRGLQHGGVLVALVPQEDAATLARADDEPGGELVELGGENRRRSITGELRLRVQPGGPHIHTSLRIRQGPESAAPVRSHHHTGRMRPGCNIGHRAAAAGLPVRKFESKLELLLTGMLGA